MRIVTLVLLVAGAMACGPGGPKPAPLDPRNDACANCRMTVSSTRFASQVVAPGEEPAFFDDLGCLAKYLAAHASLPSGWTAFVTDHRTGEWVTAADATYTFVPTIETPMGSHLVAHATPSSRDADVAARGGRPETLESLFPTIRQGGAR